MLNPYSTSIIKIKDIKVEADNIKIFTLAFKNKADGEKFRPVHGQMVVIGIPGFGEAPFAPCSCDFASGFFQICVRNAGTLTEKMHSLKNGDEMTVRGPYGLGTFPETERNLLLIAGGLGLVPLRSLIQKYVKSMESKRILLAPFRKGGIKGIGLTRPPIYEGGQGDVENRISLTSKHIPNPYLEGKGETDGDSPKMQLFYGARSSRDLIFKDDYKNWKKYVNMHIILDKEEKGWKGHVGLITNLCHNVPICVNPVVIMCGPQIMYKFVLEEIKKLNVKDEDIYLSLERRMHCGVGVCQHCAVGSKYVCKDGPVFKWSEIKNISGVI